MQQVSHSLMRWIYALLTLVLASLAISAGAASLQGDGFLVQSWHGTAPDSVMRDLQGRTWRLSDLRGKAVLLNFWASWCEPCRSEMPSLQALQALHGEEVVILALNYKESPESVQRFVQRQAWVLPMVTDPEGALARHWGIGIFPSSVLIDARGRVQVVVRGEVDWQAQQDTVWMQRWLGAAR